LALRREYADLSAVAAPPAPEADRLAALRKLAALDTGADPRLDALTRRAADIACVPMAMVSLVDEDRQWFKSAVGAEQGASTPRSHSFCSHAIERPDSLMVIEDAAEDPRFAGNPLVTGPPYIRFYAAAPLRDQDGLAVGTLCLIDTVPHVVDEALRERLSRLEDLANSVMAILELGGAANALRESESLGQLVLSQSANSINLLDIEGNVLFMNAACRQSLHLDPAQSVKGISWVELWPESERPQIQAQLETARCQGEARVTARCRRADGSLGWWDNVVTLLPGTGGKPARLLSSSRDVTEAKLERDEVNAARQQLASVLESTTDNVIVVDNQWVITYLNRHAVSLVGEGRVWLGASLWAALPYANGSAFHQACSRAKSRREAVTFEDYLASHGLWLEVHVFPTTDGMSIFFRDATERHRVQAQLVHLAEHDSLTGLANRFVLHRRMAELARAGQSFAILQIDLDHFKDVNDTFGHPVGDALLLQAAGRLRDCVRREDSLARLGGDEFAVLVVGPAQEAEATSLATRIISEFAISFELAGLSLACGVSIGIALTKEGANDPDLLLKDADLALYSAKSAGRGTFRFFSTDLAEQAASRQDLKMRLQSALDDQEMAVHFQPVIDLKTSGIVGFEALLRWRPGSLQEVPPSVFIPVAEESGLIVKLGRWALMTACRQAACWPDPVWVAVNLSPVQFRDPGLVETVSAALQQAGLPAYRLELEITETALLRDDEGTIGLLNALRALGVRIALDDFGTGYASLTHLRSFAFDKIKIDRSFISDLPGGVESSAIVRAMTTLGRSLSMTITAEGVETQEQYEAVGLRGCSEAQGYYFSRPLPAEAATRLLAGEQGCGTNGPIYGRNMDLPPSARVLSRHI
jgi:diguanylate cyclase (GGDEF)-like protein/PAS domain S-box-containing protein